MPRVAAFPSRVNVAYFHDPPPFLGSKQKRGGTGGLRVQLRKQQNNGSVYWMHRESARERYGDT